MKITFKDVGQGDSILLEWTTPESIKKIGIIDCNLKGKSNPVLDAVISEEYSSIEFIILSHPHKDHYSGLKDLLLYIKNKKIVVERFGHTLHLTGIQYWKWFELEPSDSKLLREIIDLVNELNADNLIRRITLINSDSEFHLSQNISLRCLSPSHDEGQHYMQILNFDPEKDKKKASSAANFLSTIFKLHILDAHILFTSDAEISSFSRLHQVESQYLKDKVFHIIQAPHHGSSNNYYPDFWEALNTFKKKHAIFSAGENRKYNHPDFSIVQAYHSKAYTLHATNVINGMKEYKDYIDSLKTKSSILDSDSEIAEEYIISGDKAFLYDQGTFIQVT